MDRFASLIGIFALLGVCYFFSTDRKRVSWRIVLVGIGFQAYLAAFLVRSDWVPWLLTIASTLCLGMLVGERRFLGDASDDDTSLRAFGVIAARALGQLGFLTCLITAWIASSDGWGLLVLFLAVVAYRAPPRVQRVIPWVGCVGVVAFLWRGILPNNFAYLALDGISTGVLTVVNYAGEGARWVFAGLGDPGAATGWIFAVQVGSIVILFSALMSLLYYLGVLPWLVRRMAGLLYRGMGVSGAESLSAASNVFIGQTEAPLVVRPYLDKMTRSEIMALMAGGFATIAGSVFGAYVAFLTNAGFARAGADLIAASVMSAPAAFVFAKLLVPETGEPVTSAGAELSRDQMGTNALDALAGGVTAGVRLAVNIAAMLLVFYALIAMLNDFVTWLTQSLPGWLHPFVGDTWSGDMTFQDLYGYLFAPFAWFMGVPTVDCVAVGELIGTKTIFNEFIAYEELGKMIEAGKLQERSIVLATYALCGFANFMSIGIQIGGLAALAPSRRSDFASLAFKAMIAGLFACQLTACIVGVIGDF